MTEFSASWPDDADGDVFRSLETDNFDFSRPHLVEYNVDFTDWPPPAPALAWLRENYKSVELHSPDEYGRGFAMIEVIQLVTFESVTAMQRKVSAAMEPFGGVCESWGVMH